ncbi:hypothetical protein KXW02_007669, partial [Aspergillus fumigatus]
VDNGLLFAIVTSDALDFENRKRGFRYVIFDVFGTVVSRCDLEHARRTSEQATKDMWDCLNTLDAKAITRAAIERAERNHANEMADLRAKLEEAVFFTNGDTGDDNESRLNDLGVERLTREAIRDIASDCDSFLGFIMPDGCFVRQWLDRLAESHGYSEEQAGHDFWFS